MITAGTAGLIAAATAAAYWLAGRYFEPASFVTYAISRRSVSAVVPVLLLGLGMALTRETASDGKTETASTLAWLAATLVAIAWSAFALGVILIPDTAAQVFLGSFEARAEVIAAVNLTGGLAMQAIAYSLLRGRLRFRQANLVKIVVFVVAQPLSVVLSSGNLSLALHLYACVAWATGIATLFLSAPQSRVSRIWALRFTGSRRLLAYGLPRLPGDMSIGFLLASPALLASQFSDLQVAGVLALGSSGITLIGTALSPLSTLLLPYAARSFSAGENPFQGRPVRQHSLLLIVITSFVTSAAAWYIAPFVPAYLAAEWMNPWLTELRLLLLGTGPYLMFVTCRSIVDAAYRRAYNASSAYIAFGAMLMASAVLASYFSTSYAIALGHAFGLAVLGGRTLWIANTALKNIP